jgi:hypothetical protein
MGTPADGVWHGYAAFGSRGEFKLVAEAGSYWDAVRQLRLAGWPGPFLIIRRGAVRGGVATGQPGVVRGRRKAEGKEG